LRTIVHSHTGLRSNCQRKEGWYPLGTIKKIRSKIKDRWMELIEQRYPNLVSDSQTKSQLGTLFLNPVDDLQQYISSLSGSKDATSINEEDSISVSEYEIYDEDY